MDLKEFKEKYPDIARALVEEGEETGRAAGLTEGEKIGYEKGTAEAMDAARKEGAEAERARIQAVEANTLPGYDDLIAEMKYDGKTTGEQAAVKILQAEKAKLADIHAKLGADAIDPVVPDTSDALEGGSDLPEGEEKWKAEYNASKELQEEFGDVDVYIAYKHGEAEGSVRILGRK